jgi:hypothetical protein
MKKNRNMQKRNKKSTSRDHWYAILSLLSQKTEKVDGCPSHEELALFTEGRLSGHRRYAIIIHLNDCTECRRQWQMIGSVVEEMVPKESSLFKTWYQRSKEIRLSHIFTGGGIGLALVTCLLLIFFTPRPDELEKMLSKSYNSLSSADAARYNSFVSKGEDQSLEDGLSKAMLAYKTGLTIGRSRLLNKAEELTEVEFENDLHSLLFSMGQWNILLQCSCISSESTPDKFWSEQVSIALKLRDKLEGEIEVKEDFETQQILSAVNRIEIAIKQIRETSNKVDGCDEIIFAIGRLENLL